MNQIWKIRYKIKIKLYKNYNKNWEYVRNNVRIWNNKIVKY